MNRRKLFSSILPAGAAAIVAQKAFAGSSPPPPIPLLNTAYKPRAVGTRSNYQCSFSPGTNIVNVSENTRYFDICTTRYVSGVKGIQVLFSNYGDSPLTQGGLAQSTEENGLQPITVSASIELNLSYVTGSPWAVYDAGAFALPLTWNGSTSVTIQPGCDALSDPISYPLLPGQGFYINTFRTVPALMTVVAGKYPDSSFYEYSDDGYVSGAIGLSTTSGTALSGTLGAAGTLSASTFVLPLLPGSVTFFSGSLTSPGVTDNGSGVFPATNGMSAAGSINYTTGAYSITLTTASTPAAIQFTAYGKSGATVTNDTLNRPRSGATVGLNNVGSRSHYHHTAVFGLPISPTDRRPFTFLIAGDSIDFGTGNSPHFGTSWADYCVAGQCGVVKTAQPSEKASSFALVGNRYRRLGMGQGVFDRAVCNYCTNDIINGPALATLQANVTACAKAISALLPNGINDLAWVTCLPRTASASSQTPLNANYSSATVASGSPSLRNAFNAWLFTQVGVLFGTLLDPCIVLEGNPASQAGAGDGTWKSLSLTYDGTHPSLTGNQAIAAYFGIGGTNPSPIFTLP